MELVRGRAADRAGAPGVAAPGSGRVAGGVARRGRRGGTAPSVDRARRTRSRARRRPGPGLGRAARRRARRSGSRRSCSRPAAVSRSARGRCCTRARRSRWQQVRLRGERLGIRDGRLLVLSETDVSRILAEAESRSPAVVVVDSVQAVQVPELSSAAGTVSQVRGAASELTRYAKRRGVPVLLVGHVTKDGSLAGPKSLEHLVDAVVSIDGDRSSSRTAAASDQEPLRAGRRDRPLRDDGVGALGAARRVGDAAGRAPRGPAGQRRDRRPRGYAGRSWSRSRRSWARPRPDRRAASGSAWTAADSRFFWRFWSARGSRSPRARSSCRAPAASRSRSRPPTSPSSPRSSRPPARVALPDASVFFGEIGLLGEVRRVPAAVSRLKEASALGFRTVFLPAGNAGDAAAFPDLDCRPVDRVADLIERLAGGKTR